MSELVHYRFLMSPYCARVDGVLRWLDLAARRVEVHPRTRVEVDFSRSKAVPVLRDGEQVIEGAPAILRHLDGRVAGKPRLYPADPQQRHQVEELEAWVDDAGPAAMWTALFQERHAVDNFLRISARVAPLSVPERLGWRVVGRRMLEDQTRPLLKGQTPEQAARRFYERFESLSEGPSKYLFLFGDDITAADFALFSYLVVLHRCNATLPGVPDFAGMGAWFSRVYEEARDGEEGLTPA